MSTCFSVVTEHAILLYLCVCRGCFELTNKTDKVAEAAEEGDMVEFIKRHANVQTTCGCRTHSQLILASARDARFVGKRFR